MDAASQHLPSAPHKNGAGMAFLFKHLNLSGKITNRSLMREERLEVPVSALRETLINALAHRQWEEANLTISIAVYDDRVEIANPYQAPKTEIPTFRGC